MKISKIKLLFHTVRHLRMSQLFYQVYRRLVKHRFVVMSFDGETKVTDIEEPIAKPECCNGEVLRFLNQSTQFVSWNEMKYGALWNNNVNYMDWLNQDGMSYEEGAKWIDRFIEDVASNKRGLNPYGTSLRTINWIKFICKHHTRLTPEQKKKWNDSLWSQCWHIRRNLEKQTAANHLLENLMALYVADSYFCKGVGSEMKFDTEKELHNELNEQLLEDGAHYEQSPMYHCVLIDRLLDCYNFRPTVWLKDKLEKMLGHLESITYENGDIPMFSDSANGIAPSPTELKQYGKRLKLQWNPIALKECGYRKMSNERLCAMVDIGNVMCSYQAAHSHADTFSYELRIDGEPFVVDTGISTYNKNHRRQEERGTAAHNTVVVNGKNSSEVWGGFRIGNRANVKVLKESQLELKAMHDGYGKVKHERTFVLKTDEFMIKDHLTNGEKGVSYIHLSPRTEVLNIQKNLVATNMATITIENATNVELTNKYASTEYNCLQPIKVVKIYFEGEVGYKIKTKE